LPAFSLQPDWVAVCGDLGCLVLSPRPVSCAASLGTSQRSTHVHEAGKPSLNNAEPLFDLIHDGPGGRVHCRSLLQGTHLDTQLQLDVGGSWVPAGYRCSCWRASPAGTPSSSRKAATARQLLSIRSATSSPGCVPSLFSKSCNSVGLLKSLATTAAPSRAVSWSGVSGSSFSYHRYHGCL